jgi:hypothetical protein
MDELLKILFGREPSGMGAFPIPQNPVTVEEIMPGQMPVAQPVAQPQPEQSRFRMPDFSGINLPELSMPNLSMPNLSMPNLRMPDLSGLRMPEFNLPMPGVPEYLQGLIANPEEAQKRAQQAGLMSAAMALLESSGPSPQRTSLGQAIGRGAGAYQQGAQGSFDQILQGMLLKSKLAPQEPEAIRTLRILATDPKLMATQLAKSAAGATKITMPGGNLTPGQEAVDKDFADDYVAWKTGGGQDMAAQIAQLTPVIKDLENNKPLSGVGVAIQPDLLLALTNPAALQSREQVEEVVQRNLRAVLGPQFTKEEGERLIARAFNPKLKPEQNAKRLRRLFLQMATAAEQKQAMVEFFDENGTLRGYKGKMPSANDFVSAMEGGADEPTRKPSTGSVPSSRFPAFSKEDIDLINRNLNR